MKRKPLLDQCINMFGEPLPKDIRERIRLFLLYPSPETWDDIHGILVNGHITIWQAILETYPWFTRVGRTYDDKWNQIKEWAEIPTPIMVMDSIRESLKSKKSRGGKSCYRQPKEKTLRNTSTSRTPSSRPISPVPRNTCSNT